MVTTRAARSATGTASPTPGQRPYHHGDLRAALVDAGLALIAESGVSALSMSAAARRTGVSPAAPYRHFANRDALLAAVATKAARLLEAELRSSSGPGADPVEQLAATASAYVRFVVANGAGVDLVFADDLRELGDPDLAAAGRAVIEHMLEPALVITGDPTTALALLEHHVAAAHGYATLFLHGFFRPRTREVDVYADAAARLTAQLADAARRPGREPAAPPWRRRG